MPPFRIGVMQLTMEPLEEMLASARVMDEVGMDTIWLAEAYPWWRKHGMEARSSTVVSALIARETERLTIGWGIISPFTRHPVQAAMDARVVQEAAGPGRFLLGYGTSKIFLNNAKRGDEKLSTLGAMRDAVEITRGVLGGEAFDYDGKVFSASVPALENGAHTPREVPPVYVAATAPKMQALAGELADGCLTPSITTPAFVRYTRDNVGRDIDIGCTIVASIGADRDEGRDGAREIAGMYLANKVQNIKGAADTLLDLAGLEQDEIRPIAEAMERGGRLAAKELVTDAILDKCKPIAGTPADCIEAIEEYRDAGCTHVMLELWGDEATRAAAALRRAGRAALPMIDRDRLVDLALRLVSTPSFTGSEEAAAELMRAELASLGLAGAVAAGRGRPRQRARHLARRGRRADADAQRPSRHVLLGPGAVARGIPGFQPQGFERDGRIYGLGISNMKGALACYVEAVRSLQDAGVRLQGDVLVAAVAGEIEKTQQGDAQGAEYRGYAAGSRHLVGHGGAADMCILGEPTENKLVLAHFGALWMRLSTHGPFVHTAFSSGRLEENSIVRMRGVLDAVLEWLPRWEEEMSYDGFRGSRTSARSRAGSAGASRARRTRPTSSSTCACRRRCRWPRRAGRRSSSRAGSTGWRRRCT